MEGEHGQRIVQLALADILIVLWVTWQYVRAADEDSRQPIQQPHNLS